MVIVFFKDKMYKELIVTVLPIVFIFFIKVEFEKSFYICCLTLILQ